MKIFLNTIKQPQQEEIPRIEENGWWMSTCCSHSFPWSQHTRGIHTQNTHTHKNAQINVWNYFRFLESSKIDDDNDGCWCVSSQGNFSKFTPFAQGTDKNKYIYISKQMHRSNMDENNFTTTKEIIDSSIPLQSDVVLVFVFFSHSRVSVMEQLLCYQ